MRHLPGITRWTALLGVVLAVLLVRSPQVDSSAERALVGVSEQEYLALLNECTTGLASGAATPDGRPLLWKNRDVGNVNQEFQYYDDGRIPFIGITYRGETDEYYGGLNAAGFALENSNSYNLERGPAQNGWGYGDDDGEIHTLALATCRTVDDFQALLDSTNEAGRTLNCNYGAFDAYGEAAMFETGGYSYARYDAVEQPDGFVIRSNYSYSGTGLDNRPSYWGANRHDRAYQLWKAAKDQDNLTPAYIFRNVIRDLAIDGTDPNPLPFEGYVGHNEYGCIPNGEAICRSTTRAIMLAQGVRDGQRPDDAILWAMAGNQIATVALPLWVRAGSVPEEFDSDNGSRICNRGIQLADWVYQNGAVNTWKLTNPSGTGIWDYTFGLEDWGFAKVERFLDSPEFNYDRLESFQNRLARQVADSLEAWQPAYSITELSRPIYEAGTLTLAWGGNQDNPYGGGTPRQFAVYRDTGPFRDGEGGELLQTMEGDSFTDNNPPPQGAFYRIEARF